MGDAATGCERTHGGADQFVGLRSDVGLVPGAASAVTGDAGYSRYVTHQEFRNVRKGMSMARVHQTFDIKGKQTAYFGGYKCGTYYGFCPSQDRDYRTKSRWGSVTVTYAWKPSTRTWVLDSKYAFWG